MNDDIANAIVAILYKNWSHKIRDEKNERVETVFSCRLCDLVQEILNEVRKHGK